MKIMKTIKYLFIGAMMLTFAAPATAQDEKAVIDQITNAIKSKPADLNAQVKAVYKKYKKSPAVLVAIGQAYYDVKDTANARTYAEYGMKLKYSPAYMLMGDIKAYGDDGGGAAAFYDQAIYFDPKNPEPYYKYASVYRKISPTQAVAKLEDLRIHRPDIAVDALAGRIYYTSNEFDKAIAAFNKADKNKMEERDISNFAMAYYFKGEYAKSLDIAKFGLKNSPRSAAFNRLAFFNCTDLKDYDIALAYADALFNKSDSAKFSYFDYTYYGNALNGAKKHDEAITMFKKALEQEFDSKDKRAGVIKALSDAYSTQEKYDEAIEFYNQYLQEYSTPTATDYAGLPQLYYYKSAKAEGQAKTDDLKKADQLYAELMAKYPDAAEYATFWRARVNNAIDDDQKNGLAKPYYEKLIELYSSRTELNDSDNNRLKECYLYLISYYARVANDIPSAKNAAGKLLEIDPDNGIAKQVMEIK